MKNKLKFLIAAVVAASAGSKVTASEFTQNLEIPSNNSISNDSFKRPMPILRINNLQGDFTSIISHRSHSSHRSHGSHFSHSSHHSGGMFI